VSSQKTGFYAKKQGSEQKSLKVIISGLVRCGAHTKELQGNTRFSGSSKENDNGLQERDRMKVRA